MKAQDYKDIKITNNDISKVVSNNGVLWSWIDDTSGSPGPKRLIGGNLQAGFYGEVPANEFITGDELAKQIGLYGGTRRFSNEPWLKFSYLGKTEFIAKKPFALPIAWNDINAANAVFGNKTIKIGDHTYKVRLPKGKSEGKQDDSSSVSGSILHNSEWNRLMLPIHINAPDKWTYPDNVKSPTEKWGAGYTNNDLFIQSGTKGKYYSWCQEYSNNIYFRLTRGYFDVSYASGMPPDTGRDDHGWRPVLELVD